MTSQAPRAAMLALLLLAGLELGNAGYTHLLRAPTAFPGQSWDLGLPATDSMPRRVEDSERPLSFWYAAMSEVGPGPARELSLGLWVTPAAPIDSTKLELRLGSPPVRLVACVSSAVAPSLEVRAPEGVELATTFRPTAAYDLGDGSERGRRLLVRWQAGELLFRAGEAEAVAKTPPGWSPDGVALAANHAPLRLHRLWVRRLEREGVPPAGRGLQAFAFEPGLTSAGAQALVTAAGVLAVLVLWALPLALLRRASGPVPASDLANPAGPRLALFLAAAVLTARVAISWPAWDTTEVYLGILGPALALALGAWVTGYRQRFVGDPWSPAEASRFLQVPAGAASSLVFMSWLGVSAAGLVLVWWGKHLDPDWLAPSLLWPAAASCAVFPLVLTLAGPWRVPRPWLLALPALVLSGGAAAAPWLGWTPICPLRLLPHGLVAAAALWQMAVLVVYQDFLRPAGLLLLAPALVAVATVESGIKTFLGPHPFMGDCIFWYAEMAPESLRIRDFRGSLFRGQEVEPDKGDRFRVLVVGGSVVFGASLPWGADYPSRLQPALDRTTSGKLVEVLNGGIPAFTSEMGLALLQERLLRLQPDLVISAWGVNDMAGNGTGPGLDRAFVERERWVAAHPWLKVARDATRQSGLYLWLRRAMLQKWIRVSDGTFEPTPGAGQRVTPAQFEENLRTLARLGRERGFRVAYTLDVHASELELPCDDPRSRNWGGEAGRIVRQVARDEGLTWLDARLAFCDPRVPTSELFFDGLHLSERGCSLMAQELARQLKAAGLLNDSWPSPPGIPMPQRGLRPH